MKILQSLPKGDNLQHDAPLLNIIKIAKPAFILISSLTVFIGVYSHLSGYIEGISLWFTIPIYLIVYFLVSLFPDVLNSIAAGYIARSFIKGLYTDRLTKILMVFCLVLVFPLTKYSFNMSTTTAGAAIEAGSEEQPEANTDKIDNAYNLEITRITKEYETEKENTNSQFDAELLAATVGINAKIKAQEQNIETLENNRKDDNTNWTDTKQIKARAEIARLTVEKSNIELPIILGRKDALRALKVSKETKESTAESLRTGDRGRVITEATTKGESIKKVTAILKKQFSGLAGYSVFVVLLLTGVEQVLHHRNEIEFEFRFTLWDAGVNPIAETIGLPFTIVGRKIINGVRKQYGRLEDMAEAVIYEVEHNTQAKN